jgi:hypothetical protein
MIKSSMTSAKLCLTANAYRAGRFGFDGRRNEKQSDVGYFFTIAVEAMTQSLE